MATVPHTFPNDVKKSGHGSPTGQQLRRDRMTAVVVLAIIAALLALMLWLASIANGAPEGINEYWPIML